MRFTRDNKNIHNFGYIIITTFLGYLCFWLSPNNKVNIKFSHLFLFFPFSKGFKTDITHTVIVGHHNVYLKSILNCSSVTLRVFFLVCNSLYGQCLGWDNFQLFSVEDMKILAIFTWALPAYGNIYLLSHVTRS